MKTMGVLHPEGEFQSLFSDRSRFNIVEDLRFVAFGRDLVSLDPSPATSLDSTCVHSRLTSTWPRRRD
jgi:hypothetical protein